jgi:hypothetical protein
MVSYSEGAPASYPAGNLGVNARGYRDSYVGNDSTRDSLGCGPSNGYGYPDSNRESNEGSDSDRNGPSYVESNGQSSHGINLEDNLRGSPPGEVGDFREYAIARCCSTA